MIGYKTYILVVLLVCRTFSSNNSMSQHVNTKPVTAEEKLKYIESLRQSKLDSISKYMKEMKEEQRPYSNLYKQLEGTKKEAIAQKKILNQLNNAPVYVNKSTIPEVSEIEVTKTVVFPDIKIDSIQEPREELSFFKRLFKFMKN